MGVFETEERTGRLLRVKNLCMTWEQHCVVPWVFVSVQLIEDLFSLWARP